MLAKADLAKKIDHTLLKPYASPHDIEQLCREAADYGFWSVCIPPTYAEEAAAILGGTKVKVCAVVGFPLGYNTKEAKAAEAKNLLDIGVDELDMVMNIGMFKAGRYDVVEEEIREVAGMCKAKGRLLKVIIECCYLTDEEKVRAAKIVEKAGADFVKTSTGFGPSGALEKDVRLLRCAVSKGMGIKAAGGVNSLERALAMINAGADRIGASHSLKIMSEWKD